MKIKKGDKVKITYTGIIKEDNRIFDTTDEETAKKEDIHMQDAKYGPVTIEIGKGEVLKGLEDELIGKETGKEYTIELSPEKAFGKKTMQLLQRIPMSAFKKQGIMPQPGMTVNIDNVMGTVKIVSGGRIIVDFNHPLANKEVIYKVKCEEIEAKASEPSKEGIKEEPKKVEVKKEVREEKPKEITEKKEDSKNVVCQ